uniref:Uncharacterized protein n=1 Tax=Panagrolaimus sp. PS1159 TaxID=55785 RepID=A0AC35G3R9_9BILA
MSERGIEFTLESSEQENGVVPKPRPFMQSDGDFTPILERKKSRISSKSAAYIRRESSHASSMGQQRMMGKSGRTTSLTENIWKSGTNTNLSSLGNGSGGITSDTTQNTIIPDHLKPKRTNTQPGLRSMLYGLSMKMEREAAAERKLLNRQKIIEFENCLVHRKYRKPIRK